MELIYHTLITLGFPLREVHQFAEAIRHDNYDFNITTEMEHRSLHDLHMALKGIEIVWIELSETSYLVGKSLSEANIRSQTGASVVALVRDKRLIANPKSMTVFEAGDQIGLIGEKDQIEALQVLISE